MTKMEDAENAMQKISEMEKSLLKHTISYKKTNLNPERQNFKGEIKKLTTPLLRKANRAKQDMAFAAKHCRINHGYYLSRIYWHPESYSMISHLFSECGGRFEMFMKYSLSPEKGEFYYRRRVEAHGDTMLLIISRIINDIYVPVKKLGLSFISQRDSDYAISKGGIGIEGLFKKNNASQIGKLILTVDDIIDDHIKNYKVPEELKRLGKS